MAAVQINLSETMQAYLDAVVADGDHADASAFVEALLRADSARFDELRALVLAGDDAAPSLYLGKEIVERAFERHRHQCA